MDLVESGAIFNFKPANVSQTKLLELSTASKSISRFEELFLSSPRAKELSTTADISSYLPVNTSFTPQRSSTSGYSTVSDGNLINSSLHDSCDSLFSPAAIVSPDTRFDLLNSQINNVISSLRTPKNGKVDDYNRNVGSSTNECLPGGAFVTDSGNVIDLNQNIAGQSYVPPDSNHGEVLLNNINENIDRNESVNTEDRDGNCIAGDKLIEDSEELLSLKDSLEAQDTTTMSSTGKKLHVLSEWCIKAVKFKDNPPGIIVEGQRPQDKKGSKWHSTSIVKRINSHLLETKKKSQYRLVGEIQEEITLQQGFSQDFIKAFKNGFPSNWEKWAQEHFDSIISPERKPAKPRRMKTKKSSKQKTPRHKNDGTPVEVELKRTSSGRLVKPPLAWWRGQRIMTDGHHNLTGIDPGGEEHTALSVDLYDYDLKLPKEKQAILHSNLMTPKVAKFTIKLSSKTSEKKSHTILNKETKKNLPQKNQTVDREKSSTLIYSDNSLDGESASHAVFIASDNESVINSQVHNLRQRPIQIVLSSDTRESSSNSEEKQETSSKVLKNSHSNLSVDKKVPKQLSNSTNISRSKKNAVVSGKGSDDLTDSEDSLSVDYDSDSRAHSIALRTRNLRKQVTPKKNDVRSQNSQPHDLTQKGRLFTAGLTSERQKSTSGNSCKSSHKENALAIQEKASDSNESNDSSLSDENRTEKEKIGHDDDFAPHNLRQRVRLAQTVLTSDIQGSLSDDDEEAEAITAMVNKARERRTRKENSDLDDKQPPLQAKGRKKPALAKSEKISDDGWREDELFRLTMALNSFPLSSAGFWQKVADSVETRTAQECQSKYEGQLQKPKRESKKPKQQKQKRKVVAVTGGVGTVKRKRELRELIQQNDAGYCDDIFDSTPFKKSKTNFKIPLDPVDVEDDDDDDTIEEQTSKDFKTTSNQTPSSRFRPLGPGTSDTPNDDLISPSLLQPVDRAGMDHYIQRMKQGKRGMYAQTTKVTKTSTPSKMLSVHLPTKLNGSIFEAIESHDPDSSEESDDYFSE